jgi:hypothetical protein
MGHVNIIYFNNVPKQFGALTQNEWHELDWDSVHRDDGPAVIAFNGRQEWFKHGKCHREDGPAIIIDDKYAFYLHDIELSFDSYIEVLERINPEMAVLVKLTWG